MTHELDGDPCEVECPLCEGDGEITETMYYAQSADEWVVLEIEPTKCWMCEGVGRLDDVPVWATLEYP